MATKARIEDGVVMEVLTANPFLPFHPSLVWVECDTAAAPGWRLVDGSVVPPPRPPFAERLAQRLRAVDLIAKDKRDAVVADYSPAEMASWPIKRAEALAYTASGNPADAPGLAAEAAARRTELPDLAALVLAKAQALAALEAQIAGHTGLLQDRLRAVAEGDFDGLEAVDILAGWPQG